MSDVTQILAQIEAGDPAAAEHLLPLVYDELRKLASARLAHEKPGQTLSATALVHEAYLKIVGGDPSRHWHGRAHFFVAASEAMRRILVDSARRKAGVKRGGGWRRCDISLDSLDAPQRPECILAIDEALQKLAGTHEPAARLVKLRYYGGLPLEEAASVLDVSARTARRYWDYAKAWLLTELSDGCDP